METPHIPKSFILFGELHKVKMLKQVDRGKSVGEWDPNKNIIRLAQKDYEGLSRNPEAIEQTYYHELTHCLLEAISRHELSDDETFVDLMAKCLHQISKTAIY